MLGVAAGAAVVAAGVLLRFWTRSPLWLDEALSANIADLPVGDIPDALRRDGHPPLYYVLLHGWTSLVGESDRAVRALSGVAAVLSLPLAWLVGRRLGGRPAGWAAVVLLATSPYALRYATEARMYSLVTLLTLAGAVLLPAALDRPRPLHLAGIAALTSALLWTHYWSVFLLAAVGALVLARRAWPVLAAMAVGALTFLPWVPTLLHQNERTGTPWARPGRPTQSIAATIIDFGGGNTSEGQILGILLVLLVLLGLLGAALGRGRIELDLRTRPLPRPWALVAGGTLALGVAVGFVTGAAYATRYAAGVFPLVILLAALGVSRIEGPVLRQVLLAVAVLPGLAGAYRNVTVPRTQGGAVVAAIAAQARPGDVVVTCPDQLGPAFTRGLPEGIEAVAYPTGGTTRFVDWTDYEERNQRARPRTFARQVLDRVPPEASVWLVFAPEYRTFGTQCTRLNDALTNARPLAQVVVSDDPAVFEHAWLVRFPPAAP